MAFLIEACVEVVAVVITFLCVGVVHYCRRCSEAAKKSIKKNAELEADTEVVKEEEASVEEEASIISAASTTYFEEEDKERREFNAVSQRLAGRLAGLLQEGEKSDWKQAVEIQWEGSMSAHSKVAEEMAAFMERDVDVDVGSDSDDDDDMDVVGQECEKTDWKHAVEIQWEGSMDAHLHVAEDLIAFLERGADVEVGSDSGDDVMHDVDQHSEKIDWKQAVEIQWEGSRSAQLKVAEEMAAFLERDADAEACSDSSTECSDDGNVSDDELDSVEWDDVAFKMGRVFGQFAEDACDEEVDEVSELASKERVTSRSSAWDILESYGVFGAPVGTWTSRC